MTKVLLNLPDELHHKLKAQAALNGKTLGIHIAEILTQAAKTQTFQTEPQQP